MASGMKSLLTMALVVWLSMGVAACGGASKEATSGSSTSSNAAADSAIVTTSSAASTPSRLREDRDKDYGDSDSDSYFDNDDYNTVNYPYTARPAEIRAVTALVKRYLAAAVTDDGATACSLIYSLFAEAIPETLGLPPTGTPALRGKTCAVVMSKLFKINHAQLAAESATLEVATVRVNDMRGFALLHFKGIPAHSIGVHLERGTWKIEETVPIEVS